MKIRILGSGQEIGKSAILLKGKKNIVMDYGVKLHGEEPEYPIEDKIDAGIISHAHLDHSGSSPVLQKKRAKIFMTNSTKSLTEMLISDSIKIAKKEGFEIPFMKKDLEKMAKNILIKNYNQNFKIGSFDCSLYNSGHIPGSAGIFVKSKKSIFYTADIQTDNMRLLNKCQLPEKCDILITESTYSYKNHPEREKEEKRLLQSIEEALSNDEKILLPSLAVGRAQEILLILEKYSNLVALDGMAKLATDIISNQIKNKKLFKIMKKIKWVNTEKQRRNLLKKRPIIVSTAGMLGGGNAVRYLKEIYQREGSKVILSCFQPEESPGHNLLKNNFFKNHEEQFKVKCSVEKFELSSHADRKGLFSIIEKTKPETVISVHGEKCKEFAKDIEKNFSINSIAPKNGEEVEV